MAHCSCLTLQGARFTVSEAGRQRVLREHRKNVHAFVTGTLVAYRAAVVPGAVGVTYNPYAAPTFFRVLGTEMVLAADVAWLDHHCHVWIPG